MLNYVHPTLVLLLLAAGMANASERPELPGDWTFMGEGFSARVDDSLLISELPGSKGVMLVSPRTYGSGIRVRFKVLPLNPESVLVLMLSASDAGEDEGLSFPVDYDGDVAHLMKDVDCYFFAFHNAAHARTPFVRRHPFVPGESKDLDAAAGNVMTTRWHDVEIASTEAGILTMKIDGQDVLHAVDESPLAGGRLAFRLRGTKTHAATALIKDLEILGD